MSLIRVVSVLPFLLLYLMMNTGILFVLLIIVQWKLFLDGIMIRIGCRLCFMSVERRKRLRLEESEARRRTWNERFTDRNTGGIQDPDDMSRRRTGGCSELLTSHNSTFYNSSGYHDDGGDDDNDHSFIHSY